VSTVAPPEVTFIVKKSGVFSFITSPLELIEKASRDTVVLMGAVPLGMLSIIITSATPSKGRYTVSESVAPSMVPLAIYKARPHRPGTLTSCIVTLKLVLPVFANNIE
jgi:hypothetical protein